MSFDTEIKEQGFYIQRDQWFSTDFLSRIRMDVLKWCDRCEQFQVKAGISQVGDGTAHHALGDNDSIRELILLHPFHDYLSMYFQGGAYILHACNPVSGISGHGDYIRKIHRDTNTYIENYNFRVNVLLALEDFTSENGATQILPFPFSGVAEPSEEYFNQNCIEVKLKKGEVLYFNSYIWHRGGKNLTDLCRPALTLSFGPPFIKPQMDYVRLLGEDFFVDVSDQTKQVLGYYSRVPASLLEWYKPKAERFYRNDQG
jgi:hypothetical protein